MDDEITINIMAQATELTKLYYLEAKHKLPQENSDLKGKSVSEVFSYFLEICRKELCLSRDYEFDNGRK